MSTPRSYPGAFRRVLHRELQHWLTEGLVTQEFAAHLDTRYALGDAVAPRVGAFAAFLYGLGGLLIGGGVIAFIGYNWEQIPDSLKIVTALALMLLFQGAGYHWIQGPRPALGHGLLLIGTVLFGANIGLIAQVYDISGHWSGGFGIWAFGATALAYVVGSVPIMLIAVFAGASAFFGALGDDRVLWSFSVLVGFQTMPFAILHRSALVMSAGMILFAIGLAVGAAEGASGHIVIAAICVAGTLFSLIAFTLRQDQNLVRLGRIAQQLGGIILLGLAFFLSLGFVNVDISNHPVEINLEKGFATMLVGLFGVLCLVWLGPVARQWDKLPGQVIALGAAVLSGALMAGCALAQSGLLAFYAGILALLGLGFALAWTGLAQRERGLYFLGASFLCARLATLFLFGDANLLFKALGMVLGGIALIVVALQYERWTAIPATSETQP